MLLACLLAIGPVMMHLLSSLRDSDGGHATSLLINDSPVSGIGFGALAVLVAAVVGIAGAYLFSMGTGFLAAGFILAWARWGLGSVDSIVRRTTSGHDLPKIAIEGLVLGLCGVAIGAAMYAVSARRQPDPAKPGKTLGGFWGLLLRADADTAPVKPAVVSLVVGVLAGGAVSWLVGTTHLPGQTLMAAVCAAIAAGAAGQLAAASMGATLTPVIPATALAIIAVTAPFAAQVLHGARLVDAVYSGAFLGCAKPMSFDWVAGAMLGAPIGLGWAGAMLDVRAAED